MKCLTCGEYGLIHSAKIFNPSTNQQEKLYICDECDATWLDSEMTKSNWYVFEDYMKSLGYKGLWSELTNVEPLK